MSMNDTTRQKYERLRGILEDMQRVAVAFSGGVDSALLLAVAHDVLGDEAFAITANSDLFPQREICEAVEFCRNRNIEQMVFDVNIDEVNGLRNNTADRCYLCKVNLFGRMKQIAETREALLLDGSNMDDVSDFRPGSRAICELGIQSPLQEACLYKDEIRELSRMLDLPTAEKQSFACLATRFPYGEKLTKERLSAVDAAEQMLVEKGFDRFRVRAHGNVARIEIPEDDFGLLLEDGVRREIYTGFKVLGFDYTALDLLGYRTGSTNEAIEAEISGAEISQIANIIQGEDITQSIL